MLLATPRSTSERVMSGGLYVRAVMEAGICCAVKFVGPDENRTTNVLLSIDVLLLYRGSSGKFSLFLVEQCNQSLVY